MPGTTDKKPINNVSEMNQTKLRIIHQELILLFHALMCKGCQCRNWSKYCVLPLCKPYKEILDHLFVCQANKECSVRRCSSSKIILRHWATCGFLQNDCIICNILIRKPNVNKFGYNDITGPVKKTAEIKLKNYDEEITNRK